MSLDSHTILLVDDNDDLREVTMELLEAMGHRVLDAPRAEAAVRVFEHRGAEIELLVSEIVSSGMDGIELADRLRASKPSLGVLLVSTHDNHRDLRQRVERGDLVFLRKPFSVEELSEKIERAVAGARLRQGTEISRPRVTARPEPVPVGILPKIQSRRPVLVRSAAAGLAVFGMLALARFVSMQPPALPDQVPESITRSLMVEPISPAGELRTVPRELRWRPVAEATSYQAQLLRVDGSVLWQGISTGPAISLPDDVRIRLRPRVVYFWQIDAFNNEGLRLSGSERVRFLVGAQPASGGDLVPPS